MMSNREDMEFGKFEEQSKLNATTVRTVCKNTIFESVPVQLGDTNSIDAFGRLRVSNPETIFDSKNIFDNPDLTSDVENQPLFYDNQQTDGAGTATEYRANEAATRLSVSDSTAGTHLDAATENIKYALLGIRLKENYIGEIINLLTTSLQIQSATHKILWEIYFNPTVAGTFTYTDLSLSAVQVAKGVTANTVTGGICVASGFAESGGPQTGSAGSISADIRTALNLGASIDGTRDAFVLTVMPIGGSSNVDVEGELTWRELN